MATASPSATVRVSEYGEARPDSTLGVVRGRSVTDRMGGDDRPATKRANVTFPGDVFRRRFHGTVWG
jgi:hypothetical protein